MTGVAATGGKVAEGDKVAIGANRRLHRVSAVENGENAS